VPDASLVVTVVDLGPLVSSRRSSAPSRSASEPNTTSGWMPRERVAIWSTSNVS
jgi:hypothetical protein